MKTKRTMKVDKEMVEKKTWEDDADRMPIAFDVEKVVREIRDLKLSYYMTIANTGDADKDYVYLNVANAIDTAIEIVKRGGRDDWKRVMSNVRKLLWRHKMWSER